MKVLALEIESPGTPAESFVPYLREEARAVWQLYRSGTVREAHFRADQKAAVLVLEATDRDEAERVLADLPLVKHGLIRFEIIPLQPYPGWERLFSDV